MNYFAIQVKTRGEGKFLSLVEHNQRLKDLLDIQNGELIWPRRELSLRRKGRVSSTQAPIFPGYVFLKINEINPDIYWSFRRIDGFYKILKSNTNIEPLTGKDLDLLLHFLSFGEVVSKSTVSFDLNQKIIVKSGPLKGLEGAIIKVDKRKGRAKIQLYLYKESFFIDFGFELIESVI